MSRPRLHEGAPAPAFVSGRPRIRYLVVRQEDVWFIMFDGHEYGPYVTEREAMLFAVDAAQKLGEQGEHTEVLRVDESGEPQLEWSYGDPPRL